MQARSIRAAVSSSPPTSPAQTPHSCCGRPARSPWVRRDPGQTPSHSFLPCCHQQSVTPLPEPPSTYVQSHNCKERPLPSSFSSPRACSPWVKNAVFPEIWSPPALALRPKLFDTFQDYSLESSACRSIVCVFQLHIIAHVQVGRGYLLPTRFDTPPFLRGPLPSLSALSLPRI